MALASVEASECAVRKITGRSHSRLNLLRCFYAVHLAFELNVHQHQVRMKTTGSEDCLLPILDHADDIIVENLQPIRQIGRNYHLIFHDQ